MKMQNLDNNLQSIKTTLSEHDLKVFKKWLKSHLDYGPVTVTFKKKDGTDRVMKCTTNAGIIPQEPVITEDIDKVKKEKKKNDEVISVYDLESKGWRSFRWDSVKEVKLEI